MLLAFISPRYLSLIKYEQKFLLEKKQIIHKIFSLILHISYCMKNRKKKLKQYQMEQKLKDIKAKGM